MILRAESASRRDLILLGVVVGPDADRQQQAHCDQRGERDQDLLVRVELCAHR
jgi:hypothetical protein